MNQAWHLMFLYNILITNTAGSECLTGSTGPPCEKQNIARGKATYQTDTLGQHLSELAVNGIITKQLPELPKYECSHTDATTNASWSVKLSDTVKYNITNFTLYLRDEYPERYTNLRVLVDGNLCQHINITAGTNGKPSPNPVNGHCNQPLRGNNVSVHVDNNYLTLCEVQVWGEKQICVCSDGWFGVDCGNSCNCLNTSEICDKKTGYCRSGCARGWQGDGCQKECVDGMYGENCNSSCGNCTNGNPCNKVNGTCHDGCQVGFEHPFCQECAIDFYGDCSSKCGHCSSNDRCDNVTGSCLNGCQEGYLHPLCEECVDGMYGENCNSSCGNCTNGNPCNKVNGTCDDGCQVGYEHPLCQECAIDFYGDCSSKCGHCSNSARCDNVTGSCLNGCQEGYLPPLCEECVDGMYGENCNSSCGNCTNGHPCNKVNGQCPDGCQIGFEHPLCQECAINFYGDCSSKCGHCSNKARCDNVTGSCLNGCQEGYLPPLCEECTVGFYGARDCSSKCGQCHNNANCDNVTGSCPNGCQEGYQPPLCEAKDVSSPENPLSVVGIVGGVVAAVVVLVAVVLVVMFLLRRKKTNQERQQGKQNFDNSQSQNQEDTNENDRQQTSPVNDNPEEVVEHYYNNIPANIPLDILKEHVRKNIAQGGFESEYKMIRYGLHGNHEIGKRPENKPRNRFRDLFPYDHSRVKLVPDGASTWDYINASFVSGYTDDTTFIAAQGPNPVTVDDFWRMVWQQNVRKIVMLTRLMEMNKKKCEQYWPEGDEAMQCGNIKVQTTLSTVKADFTIRKFKIQHTNSPKRTVTQFHFTTWPDHGVPTAPALVGFWKQVKHADAQTDEEAGPPIIHCSAGVGRTGTFIALDSLVIQAETENKVNVFMFVARMREARMNMVQTEKQYQFVYEALVEALESRGTFYTLSEFDLMYGNDRTYTSRQKEELRGQFKSLQSLKTDLTEGLVSDSLLPENVKKNRSEEILPPNRSRPFLMTTASGCNDYINAVMLPSATISNFYIVTETPLPETVVDFWRLVYDHDCYIIVCLDDSKDAMSLYPREMTSSTVGPFNVETQSELRTRDSYVHIKMTISHKDEADSKREIEVYRFAAIDTTSGHLDSGTILEFINDLHSNSNGDDQKMLIHCFDGSRVSGVFCSLMNIVSRLRLDKEVDIFLTIRELQSVRPQFVHTYEQYKLCHDMVKEYSRSSNIYANM